MLSAKTAVKNGENFQQCDFLERDTRIELASPRQGGAYYYFLPRVIFGQTLSLFLRINKDYNGDNEIKTFYHFHSFKIGQILCPTLDT